MAVLTMAPGSRSYDITVQRNALSRVGELFDLDRRVLILTDSGVPAQYVQAAAGACRTPFIMTVQAGEASKSPECWLRVLSRMAEYGFDRHDCLVSVGGGVVGDLGGFAAACYMRGIDFYQVPTTLLSQVDSSIGGKTAIDLDGYKNQVGAFWQPAGVLIDPDVLDTLDARQFACGMAEIIKMFALYDGEMFARLERAGAALPADRALTEEVVLRALAIKKRVVEADETESGLRKVLNFGHTVGHAIESVSAESGAPLFHGECVGLGMLCVTHGTVRERIAGLIKQYGLPLTFRGRADALFDAITHDKKSSGGVLTTVRVPEIGRFTFEQTTAADLLRESREVLDLL